MHVWNETCATNSVCYFNLQFNSLITIKSIVTVIHTNTLNPNREYPDGQDMIQTGRMVGLEM